MPFVDHVIGESLPESVVVIERRLLEVPQVESGIGYGARRWQVPVSLLVRSDELKERTLILKQICLLEIHHQGGYRTGRDGRCD